MSSLRKGHLLFLASLCLPIALLAQVVPPKKWDRADQSLPSLLTTFKEPDLFYAPFMFWFWDTKLNQEQLETTAADLVGKRINPGYAHARWGLPKEDFLTPAWFKAIRGAARKAEIKNMYMAYVTDYIWPQGGAWGRTLNRDSTLKAVSLKWETQEVTGGTTVTIPSCFFAVVAEVATSPARYLRRSKINGKTLRLVSTGKAGTWTAPKEGTWRVYRFDTYHHSGLDGGELNYLDKRLAPAFLNITGPLNDANLRDTYGKSIAGVWSDFEGDYGWKLAWSSDLATTFRQRTGEDIRRVIPLLIDEDQEGQWARIRWHWFDAASDLYAGFFLAITKWANARDMYHFGQWWEENLYMQAFASGDHFKLQRTNSMGSTDALVKNILDPHDHREAQSVSEFDGKGFHSELLGVAGWQMSPFLMKQAVNAAVAWGITHVVAHGIDTNRDLAHIGWPADWYKENAYWQYLDLWSDFTRRATYVNSRGHLAPDVLLYCPMESIWTMFGGDIFREETPSKDWEAIRLLLPEAVTQINTAYSQAMRELTDIRSDYLIADKTYLTRMRVGADGKLTYKSFAFKTLVLPPLTMLSQKVARKFVDFAKAGGYVYYLGDLPEASVENGASDRVMVDLMTQLRALPTVRKISSIQAAYHAGEKGLRPGITITSGSFNLIQSHRKIGGTDFYWLVNNTEDKQTARIHMSGPKGRALKLDCETGTSHAIPSMIDKTGSQLQLSFEPGEAFWLAFDPAQKPLTATVPTAAYQIQILNGPWTARIDTTRQPAPTVPTPPLPSDLVGTSGRVVDLTSWPSWGIERFSGLVEYTTTVKLENVVPGTLLDLGRVKHMGQLWINGKEVGRRLWPPFTFEVTKYFQRGENTITVRVGNLVFNAIYPYIAETQPEKLKTWEWSVNKPDPQKDSESGLLGPVTLLTPE